MSVPMPSDLTPATVEPLLRGRFGRPYRHVAECDSTQELAREGISSEGTVVTSDHQRAGRGRAGRTWDDAPGDGLLFSLVLRPPVTPALPQLSLVVALGVAEAIEEVTKEATGLKWPNDIEIEAAKVAGILLEASAGVVVCGVGINVNQSADRLPPSPRRPAGSLLLATGRPHDRAGLLAAVLATIERHYDRWRADGLAPLLVALNSRSVLNGKAVAIGDVAGSVEGISSTGTLRVRTPKGHVEVESGEIRLLA
jgi:BirA family biotin operon repressor/biotin-[acetyl-CoA-carboxylase] ligase